MITITSAQAGAPTVTARSAISPDSQGGAVVTQQLVFDASTGTTPQTVTVEALDNNIVDGDDALVFPPMTGTSTRSAAR